MFSEDIVKLKEALSGMSWNACPSNGHSPSNSPSNSRPRSSSIPPTPIHLLMNVSFKVYDLVEIMYLFMIHHGYDIYNH